jgi:hypothetical protein
LTFFTGSRQDLVATLQQNAFLPIGDICTVEKALLEAIITDFQTLAESYQRAGLLAGSTAGPIARLIGERDEIMALRRLFLLADGLLRNVVGRWLCRRRHALQHVTVFGGTQVGKSTCLNVMLGMSAARVHHTAGFTRHVQGFTPPGTNLNALFGGNPWTLHRLTRVPAAALDRERLEQYSVQQLPATPCLPHCVLWDAPDCDSVDAGRYMAGLVEAVTLADVVVYVTSREKYAVEQILAWVVLLAEAGLPLVGCLNLTPPWQQAEVLHSHQQALATVAGRAGRAVPEPAMVAFPLVEAETSDEVCAVLCQPQFAPGQILRQHVTAALPACQTTRVRQALAFVTAHLPTLLAPAQAELDAVAQWETAVGSGLEQFMQDYRQRYLDNPERYDAFARVSVEILGLLNPPIPGLHEALQALRTALSLPARLLMFVARRSWQFAFGRSASTTDTAPTPAEVQTYTEAHAHLLHGLMRVIRAQRAKPRAHPFWEALDRQWDQQMPTIQAEFHAQLTAHWQQTEQRITHTAEAIFHELEQRPAVLNALRASRLVGDAAAIVVSVQTGGAGDIIHDLVVAPALLTVLEAISRAITEGYVAHRKLELRAALLQDNRRFVDQVYRPLLLRLSQHAADAAGSLHLDAELVRRLPERIAALAAHLRRQQRG